MLWELDSLPENTLQGYAADLFETEPGRNYWKRSGTGRMSRDTGARKEVRFLQVVNQEYLRLAQKTKNNLPDAAQETSSRFKVTTTVSVIIAFVAGAAIAKSIRMRTIGANSAETRR